MKHWDLARVHLGVQYLLRGAFKKMAIADRMPLWTDPVFANPENYNSGAAWLAMLAYALQAYCDFSGYSDMAVGAAHMLGYKLTPNFDMPYLSRNIAEFWRRWHMSLSSWLRDYLYIPLGGSRAGRWRTYRNLLTVMAVGGLWHGANWNFVLFGVIQGLYLITHRFFHTWCERRPAWNSALQAPAGTVLRVVVTFLAFCLSLVVFRTPSLAAAGTLLWRILTPHAGLGSGQQNLVLLVTAAMLFAIQVISRTIGWKRVAARLPGPVLGMSYAVALTVALVLAPHGGKAFIYFQF